MDHGSDAGIFDRERFSRPGPGQLLFAADHFHLFHSTGPGGGSGGETVDAHPASPENDNDEAILTTDRLPWLKVTKNGDKLKRACPRFSLPNGLGRCGSSGFTCAAFQ